MQVNTTYEDAIRRKYPEQVVVAIAKAADGKCNPMAVGWTMITSGEPPMLAIAIRLGRHSLNAIQHSREFVISFPSPTMADDVLFFGTKSGRVVDKLAACGTGTQPAAKIDCVILSDAVANFECELEAELTTGDRMLVVGRVVAAHVNEDPAVCRLYSLGDGQLGAVGTR